MSQTKPVVQIRWILGFAISSTVVFARSALAEVSAADSAMAQALFDQGRDLLNAHQTAEACTRFAQSQKLDPKLGTLMNLAQCHEDIGKIASAWAEFGSAATQARREGQKEREDYASGQIEALKVRLSRITFHVASPLPGMKVAIDGDAFDVEVAGAGLPVDPGDHAVVVTAPGKKTWKTSFTINSELQLVDVKVPLLVDAEKEPPPTTGHHKASSRVSPLAIAGFTVGGIGIALGGITGAISLGMGSNLKSECKNGHCSSAQAGNLSTANALANVANISLPLGAVGITTGIIALVLDKPSDKSAPEGLSATLRLGPGFIGVNGAF